MKKEKEERERTTLNCGQGLRTSLGFIARDNVSSHRSSELFPEWIPFCVLHSTLYPERAQVCCLQPPYN